MAAPSMSCPEVTVPFLQRRSVEVVPYDASWPSHFESMSTKIASYLTADNVQYTCIEHVGSTSVPGLASKPNIDIFIIVPRTEQAEKARDALMWQPPPTEYYKCIGDGGIKGRLSMKFQDADAKPRRSVYIIREDDPVGMISVRGCRSLRETLTKAEFKNLRKEYADVKLALVAEQITDGIEYGRRKNEVIRKILKASGWNDEEVDVKESLDTRTEWAPPSPPY